MAFMTRTPLRVSLFGGGTDYPEYYQRNPGAVVGMAIQQYIYIYVCDTEARRIKEWRCVQAILPHGI